MTSYVKYAITFDKVRYPEHTQMMQWCEQNIGYGRWLSQTPQTWHGLGLLTWSIDSFMGDVTFAFKKEKDYIAFIMRWF